MESRQKKSSGVISLLFTMLLFLVFVLCALFTVLTGSKVYENINLRMEQSYTNSVALQYIANKVRQGDIGGQIQVKTVENTPVLELRQGIGEDAYLTWIYYLDGSIRELFTFADSGLSLEDGLVILECEGLELYQEGSLITAKTTGEAGGTLCLSLRSGGGQNE